MDKLHITQDDFGFWMLSLEKEDGAMSLVAHQFAKPDHLIENANQMIAEGKVRAVIVIDPPRSEVPSAIIEMPEHAWRKKKPAEEQLWFYCGFTGCTRQTRACGEK
jgi:hypothetical protein